MQYTQLETPPDSIEQAKCWFKSHLIEQVDPDSIAYFNNIISQLYLDTVGSAILANRGNQELDRFQKLLCQAYAEQASGRVWVFMPNTVEPPSGINLRPKVAWRTWEYPALTRNPAVTDIVKVDPNNDNQPTVIWTQGDPPSPLAPAGTNWPADV